MSKEMNPLQVADTYLLSPFDLDTAAVDKVFGQLFTRQLDYADMYFQYHRTEAWSLEEGIVKSGSFNIDQGVGVRAISGEKTAFAYSDDISLPALLSAAEATRAIGPAGGEQKIAVRAAPPSSRLYRGDDPLASLEDTAKVKLLERLEAMARAEDPRVSQVMAHIVGSWEVIMVARSDGHLAADVRPLVRVSVTVIMDDKGRREQGSGGGGGRFDYAYFTDQRLQEYARAAVHQARVNLDASPAPAGTMTVVLGSGWPGILLHEAIGHGLEGDFNRKGSSAFSGRMGQQVAAKGVTVVDDGTIADRRGS
ncbi:MAG: metallopeptidase TldD-related protein, partial [Rhodocyclaceae bacterium]